MFSFNAKYLLLTDTHLQKKDSLGLCYTLALSLKVGLPYTVSMQGGDVEDADVLPGWKGASFCPNCLSVLQDEARLCVSLCFFKAKGFVLGWRLIFFAPWIDPAFTRCIQFVTGRLAALELRMLLQRITMDEAIQDAQLKPKALGA